MVTFLYLFHDVCYVFIYLYNACLQDGIGELSQPLTPAFERRSQPQSKENTPAKLFEGLLNEVDMENIESLLDGPSTSALDAQLPENFEPDVDTEILAKSSSVDVRPVDSDSKKPSVDRVSIKMEDDSEKTHELDLQDKLSADEQTTERRRTRSQPKPKKLLPPLNKKNSNSSNTETTDLQKPNKTKGHALDELFEESEKQTLPTVMTDHNKHPASTPLRKRAHHTGDLKGSPGSPDDTKDSGCIVNNKGLFITHIVNRLPERGAMNSSVMPDLNSTLLSNPTSNDLSLYHQNIRVRVQWKKRTLLIPVSK